MNTADCRVAAVITTFNNPEGLMALLSDLGRQDKSLNEIIVIDNGSSQTPISTAMSDNVPPVIYIKMSENTGSAGGFSEGIKRTYESNDFVWTFDDDVRIAPETLSGLLAGLADAEKIEKTGAVYCPLNAIPTPGLMKFDSFPWKGTLMRSSVIQKIGLPLRGYFMYAEDLEYSLRFGERGYAIYAVTNCIIREQRVNKTGEGKGFYRDPFRLYYAYRNEINTFLLHRRPLRLLKVIFYGLKVLVRIIFIPGERYPGSAGAVLHGIRDGFLPVHGMNSGYTPPGTVQLGTLKTRQSKIPEVPAS